MDSRTARYTQTVSPRRLFELTRAVGYAMCRPSELQIKPPPPMARKETDAKQNVCPLASAPKFAPVESSGRVASVAP